MLSHLIVGDAPAGRFSKDASELTPRYGEAPGNRVEVKALGEHRIDVFDDLRHQNFTVGRLRCEHYVRFEHRFDTRGSDEPVDHLAAIAREGLRLARAFPHRMQLLRPNQR